MTVIAGSAIELPAEYPRERLLRDVSQIHRNIKNRTLRGSQRFSGEQ